ncbi:MAG: isoprenylcysteine carboxylmethyltransferase family protein [Chloroflexi bacterium]|nr:isoprenylcysteine carboxylmethyltransferase family protein [Chloroflexota bacterium]
MTALKSLLFLIFVPGMIAGYIPLTFLLTGSHLETGFVSYLAFPLWLIGSATLLWCFWDFVQKGKGTPAPIEPPKNLVASGLYRCVRNPMYAGVMVILAGHFLWFGYWGLLIYAGVFFIVVHSFVTLYEEPNLRQRFGASYEEYLQKVPRWIPRFR